MDRSPELVQLFAEFAAANAEVTAAMNEQFLAMMAGDKDSKRFDARIFKAGGERQRIMEALLNHINVHGW